MAVASAGPYANYLHLASERQPHQHLVTQCLQAGCFSWRPANSVLDNFFLLTVTWMILVKFTSYFDFHMVLASLLSVLRNIPSCYLLEASLYGWFYQFLVSTSGFTSGFITRMQRCVMEAIKRKNKIIPTYSPLSVIRFSAIFNRLVNNRL